MSWHPFETDRSYPLDYVVAQTQKHINAGRFINKSAARKRLNEIQACGHEKLTWKPDGPPLPEYKRQYVGIVVDGHKRIFCNFFCADDLPLSDKPFVVFDGGEWFFRIQYDLEDKKCYHFNANGYA